MQGLVDWVTGHWEQVKKAQARFDGGNEKNVK